MTLLLPTLAVAFAAFCVWLTVRIVNRRERWAKWTLAGLIVSLPTMYVTSFGPAVWLTAREHAFDQRARSEIESIYWPVLSGIVYGPKVISKPLVWWGELGVEGGRQALFHVDESPEGFVRLGASRQ